MKLTQNELERIADSAKLELSAEESQNYTQALQARLEQMEVLKQIEASQVEPTIDLLPLTNVFREDKVEKGLTKEQVFANAVEVENDCFKVPRII